MTQKTSFYKSYEEKQLAYAVDYFYNNYVGGDENHFEDNGKRLFDYQNEEELAEIIITKILKEERYLELEDRLEVLEAKHVRFMGKQRVSEIVKHRVAFRHKKDKWFWED